MIFFTGFPGFIGTRLVRRLLARPEGPRLCCLVYPDPAILARARALAAECLRSDRLRSVPGRQSPPGDPLAARLGPEPRSEVELSCSTSEHDPGGKIEIVPGDIARERLGLEPALYDRLRAECTEVWHLAALYNLAAPKGASYAINVEGTRNVLDLCAAARGLRKLVYYSTVVVSGDRRGTIYEGELEAGQRFRNWYEETKFLAEVEVRRRSGEVPAVVIRPAVVIGDSRSGEIDKYDGPYYMVAALSKLEREGRLGTIGRLLGMGEAPALFHLIPVDHLVEATLAIAAEPSAIGKTFHIVDPSELTVGEVRSLIFKRFGVPEFPVRVPAGVVRAIALVPGMSRLAPIPRQIFDYLDLDNRYDAANARAILEPRGVRCPSLAGYLDTIVAYVRSHPEIRVQILT